KIPAGGWVWGWTQGYRPGIYVDNLEDSITTLQQRGIEFSSGIEKTPWGRRIEFKVHEGLRWTLEEAPQLLSGHNFREPNIGSSGLKTDDLAQQKAYYHGLLGMQIIHEDEHFVALQRQAGEPYLFLETGGELIHLNYTIVGQQMALSGAWVAFSVDDIDSAA